MQISFSSKVKPLVKKKDDIHEIIRGYFETATMDGWLVVDWVDIIIYTYTDPDVKTGCVCQGNF